MNRFSQIMLSLSPGECALLHLVHIGVCRCASGLSDEHHLQQLEGLGLVERQAGVGFFHTTWLGAGVANWLQQTRQCDLGPDYPEPRDGENGDQVGPPCADFRELHGTGRCWCGRFREDHASELVKIASEMLRHHRHVLAYQAKYREDEVLGYE